MVSAADAEDDSRKAHTGLAACGGVSPSYRRPRQVRRRPRARPGPRVRVRLTTSGLGLHRPANMESEKTSYIRDVWHDNLETEMANIREMIVSYPVISMVRRVQPPPPPPLACPRCLTANVRCSAGHRVPRCRCEAHRQLQIIKRFSLPDAPVQRRSPQNHPAWPDLLHRRGRARPGGLYLPVQLQILPRRGHLRSGLDRCAHPPWPATARGALTSDSLSRR